MVTGLTTRITYSFFKLSKSVGTKNFLICSKKQRGSMMVLSTQWCPFHWHKGKGHAHAYNNGAYTWKRLEHIGVYVCNLARTKMYCSTWHCTTTLTQKVQNLIWTAKRYGYQPNYRHKSIYGPGWGDTELQQDKCKQLWNQSIQFSRKLLQVCIWAWVPKLRLSTLSVKHRSEGALYFFWWASSKKV